MVIGADETVRVSYHRETPEVETERRRSSRGAASTRGGARVESPRAGERLSKSKREERQRRQQKLRIRRVAAIAGIIVGVVSLGWGVVALGRAPIMPVRSVTVSGTHHYTADDVRRIAAIPADATLLRLPTEDIINRLSADPWIIEATVKRDFPSTVAITVKERKAVAAIDGGDAGQWFVSADDVWLGTVAESQSATQAAEATGTAKPVTVVDIPKIVPSAGKKASEPEVTNVVKVIEGLSDDLRDSVVKISAPAVEETALWTTKDVEIFIGEGEEMVTKNRIISEILGSEKNVVYINVRVTGRPTWRGLDR